jgi:murein L,D-transpeptidase YafK
MKTLSLSIAFVLALVTFLVLRDNDSPKLSPQQIAAASNSIENASELCLIGLKEEKVLELWARRRNGWEFVKEYPILAASGNAGPKFREGDRQVPEGIYKIVFMNERSAYHLSMKIDYPNAFDRARAKEDGRTRLGGDICIHGKAVSIGCIAIGDAAIEELFAMVQKVGHANCTVIIAPRDFRIEPADELAGVWWIHTLYAKITAALEPFRKPKPMRLTTNSSSNRGQ